MKSPVYGLLLAGLLAAHVVTAQADAHGDVICEMVPVPGLPGGGGMAAIGAAVGQHLRYPAAALRAGVEGRLFITFSVTPAGKVQDVRVVKSLRPDCDAAAVRAVRQLPRFTPVPARYGPTRFTIPVTFRIAESRYQPGPPSRREWQQVYRKYVKKIW